MGRYSEGDVLGMKSIDLGMTSHVETWTRCISPVEVIWMDKGDFMDLWTRQDKHTAMITYNLLRV